MKRFLALAVLLCCLLTMPLMVMAQPEEQNTDPGYEALTDEEDPEVVAEEAKQPEEKPEEKPEAPADPTPQPVDPLSDVTAIRRAEIVVIVDSRGHALVTQTMQMNVVGIEEQLRFAFPETSKNRDVQGMRTRASSENGLRYLSITNKAGFSGEHTFTLSYTIDNIVSAGEESLTMDLPLLVEQDYRVGQVALAVNMPNTFYTKPAFSSGYYGGIIEDYMTINTTSTAVTATVNDILQDSDSLMMSLTVPEDYFVGRFGKSGLPAVMRVLALLLCAAAVFFWWRSLRNPALRITARTLPPDGVNPGDMPFLLAGDKPDFHLLVTHWALLGYLSFYVNKAGHVILRRNMPMGNERRKYEQKLFDLLFARDGVCDGASLRYQKVGQRAQDVVPRFWNRRLYSRSSGSPFLARALCCLACGFIVVLAMDAVAPMKLHGLFLFLSFVAGVTLSGVLCSTLGAFYRSDWTRVALCASCGLLLLILGALGDATALLLVVLAATVFIGLQTVHGGRRTEYGQQVVCQALGFRRFMMHSDRFHQQQMLRRDPQYFYKILPFAQAMGLGRQFVAQFQDMTLEPCPWYESARGTPTSAQMFYERYLDALDMLNISLKK